MNTHLDRSSEPQKISETDEIEGDKWMDIDDGKILNVELSENENFIDYIMNNNLIKDNWGLDASNIDDSNNFDKQTVYFVLKKCPLFINIIKKIKEIICLTADLKLIIIIINLFDLFNLIQFGETLRFSKLKLHHQTKDVVNIKLKNKNIYRER